MKVSNKEAEAKTLEGKCLQYAYKFARAKNITMSEALHTPQVQAHKRYLETIAKLEKENR